MAQQQSDSYFPNSFLNAAVQNNQIINPSNSTLATTNSKCYFCGKNKYPRISCPTKDAVCHSC